MAIYWHDGEAKHASGPKLLDLVQWQQRASAGNGCKPTKGPCV